MSLVRVCVLINKCSSHSLIASKRYLGRLLISKTDLSLLAYECVVDPQSCDRSLPVSRAKLQTKIST